MEDSSSGDLAWRRAAAGLGRVSKERRDRRGEVPEVPGATDVAQPNDLEGGKVRDGPDGLAIEDTDTEGP